MSKEFYVCYGCKKTFHKNELKEFISKKAKEGHRYCPKCYQEKQDYELFSDAVCEIFGIKAPGPILNTQRKKLKAKYGYTDQTIVDCLNYLYKIEHKKKLSETLVLVNQDSIERMMKYKETHELSMKKIVWATNLEKIHHIVPIKENAEKKQSLYEDMDNWLNDDE